MTDTIPPDDFETKTAIMIINWTEVDTGGAVTGAINLPAYGTLVLKK